MERFCQFEVLMFNLLPESPTTGACSESRGLQDLSSVSSLVN